MKIVIESKYLKPLDFKDGDEATILDEGEYTPSQYGQRLNIGIKLPNGKEKIATMNKTSQTYMAKNFNSNPENIETEGVDSSEWVGKEVPIFKVKQMVSGKMKEVIYFGEVPTEDESEPGINTDEPPEESPE